MARDVKKIIGGGLFDDAAEIHHGDSRTKSAYDGERMGNQD
jgi:hypothetical protein